MQISGESLILLRAMERTIHFGRVLDLEEGFVECLRRVRSDGDALARLKPVVVVVPGVLLTRHLAALLARRGLAHANVHFLTLAALAKRLAEVPLALDGRRALPTLGEEVLIESVLSGHAGLLDYFRPVADRPGFRHALLQSLEELRHAGVTASAYARAVEKVDRGRIDSRSLEKMREVGAVWEAIEERKAERRFFDERDVLGRATVEAKPSAWLGGVARLVVYGFYDLTLLQRRLVAACAGRVPTTVFFPYEDRPAYAYAKPLRDWFLSLGFAEKNLRARAERAPSALEQLRDRFFVEEATGEVAADDSVVVVSAPGEAREAREIVREALYGPDAETTRTVGVLLRSVEAYLAPLREEFEAAGITGTFAHLVSLAQTRAGRCLRLLVRLLGTGYRRAEVMDFLSLGMPRIREDGATREAPVALWNRLSIEAGIVEGKEEWARRLQHLAESKRRAREVADEEDAPVERAEAREEEVKECERLREHVAWLFDMIEAVPSEGSWRAMADAVRAILDEYFTDEEGETQQVGEVLDKMVALDGLREHVDRKRFARALDEALARERVAEPKARAGRQPVVAELFQARGVTFDTVIVPGLVEKGFPLPARQDPILLDREREALGRALNAEGVEALLPLKRERLEEEKLLFALAVGSARRRLVLTFPRVDVAKARPRVASPFLLRVVEALEGKSADFDVLERLVREDRRGRFARISRLDENAGTQAVNGVDWDLALLGAARRSEGAAAVHALGVTSATFRRAVAAEHARWRSPRFSAYDGVLSDGEVIAKVWAKVGAGAGPESASRPLSPTRLEEYAKCPFEFLLKRVLNVEPVEEPERVVTISPQDRGVVLHRILRDFLVRCRDEKKLPPTESQSAILNDIAVKHFARIEHEVPIGYRLMWRYEQATMLEDLREWLRREQEFAGALVPRHFEMVFGDEKASLPDARRVTFDLGDGRTIAFRGRIDRIDLSPDDTQARVVDYKTGSPRGEKHDAFRGGQTLQLPMYLIGVRAVVPALREANAVYYFMTRRGMTDAGTMQQKRFTDAALRAGMGKLQEIVRTVVDGIGAGRFYPYPKDRNCKQCKFRYACALGMRTERKWSGGDPATKDYLRMVEIDEAAS